MQDVDPEDTDTIRRRLSINASTAPTSSDLRSNDSMGRKLGPKKAIIETDALLESRL